MTPVHGQGADGIGDLKLSGRERRRIDNRHSHAADSPDVDRLSGTPPETGVAARGNGGTLPFPAEHSTLRLRRLR